jgi:Na+/melibiose symporter-like transporter
VVELVWVLILILMGWACFAVLSEKPTKKKPDQKVSDRTNELLQMLLFVSVCVVALWLFTNFD